MDRLISFIVQNMNWIFEGIGVVVIVALREACGALSLERLYLSRKY